MSKETSYTKAASRNDEKPKGPPMGGLRIAKITYDHHPIYGGGSMSIGQMIDQHIGDTIGKGEMISEVSLFFETAEQQHQLAEIYRPADGFAAKAY